MERKPLDMGPKQISKRAAIEKIVAEESKALRDDGMWREELLTYGWYGWVNQTIAQLQGELDNRFPDEYVINDEL